jgi:hypothetical protein
MRKTVTPIPDSGIPQAPGTRGNDEKSCAPEQFAVNIE